LQRSRNFVRAVATRTPCRRFRWKKSHDHQAAQRPRREDLAVLRAIHEILTGAEYSPSLALAIDIRETVAHFHKTFDEVYFVLDGEISLAMHDPATGKTTEQRLGADELCVITKGVHHKVVRSTTKNRLCVICVPHFDPSDEHKSEILAAAA
jgi:mannose-6-phosphate isomerase-like protein (cupin superfamily)